MEKPLLVKSNLLHAASDQHAAYDDLKVGSICAEFRNSSTADSKDLYQNESKSVNAVEFLMFVGDVLNTTSDELAQTRATVQFLLGECRSLVQDRKVSPSKSKGERLLPLTPQIQQITS